MCVQMPSKIFKEALIRDDEVFICAALSRNSPLFYHVTCCACFESSF